MGYGTFKVCPKEFYQLYVIQCMVFPQTIPVVYALLKRKAQNTYLSLFSMLKSLFNLLDPEYYICDFELAGLMHLKKYLQKQKFHIVFSISGKLYGAKYRS
jgi:hypothetical protein